MHRETSREIDARFNVCVLNVRWKIKRCLLQYPDKRDPTAAIPTKTPCLLSQPDTHVPSFFILFFIPPSSSLLNLAISSRPKGPRTRWILHTLPGKCLKENLGTTEPRWTIQILRANRSTADWSRRWRRSITQDATQVLHCFADDVSNSGEFLDEWKIFISLGIFTWLFSTTRELEKFSSRETWPVERWMNVYG